MTQEPVFDFDQVFDEDYLFFYETFLTLERTEREVELIWRLLGLASGMRVLDLACGHGRIDLARRDADTAGVRVDYMQGDMRALPWSGEFDRVVSWFTSFGYFGDGDNRKVLAEAHRVLKPGGRLLIEMINRERVLRDFLSFEVIERDGHYVIDRIRYDPVTGRAETERVVIKHGRERRMRFGVRLFAFPELRDWLLQAGFNVGQSPWPFLDSDEPVTLPPVAS